MSYAEFTSEGRNDAAPLYPSRGWRATIDGTETEAFFWVVAVSTGANIQTVCVETSVLGEITPIFVFPGQPFMIKGKSIKSTGLDKQGNSYTTTVGATLYLYGGVE